MRSMWTALSDRDYYGDDGREPEDDDPMDRYSADEISLFMADDGGDAVKARREDA